MKIKLFVLLLVCFSSQVFYSQIVNFDDAQFKQKLLSASPNNEIARKTSGNFGAIDANNDGEIQITEASQVIELNLNCAECSDNQKFTSLVGINNFQSLLTLNCANHLLQTVDLLDLAGLRYLNFSSNLLTTIDLSNNLGLKSINVNNNLFTAFSIELFAGLQSFNIANNQLTSLDVSSSSSLQYFSCQNNNLSALTASNIGSLKSMNCSQNELTALEIIGLPSLQSLNCEQNLIIELDISDAVNLQYFTCSNNLIQSLSVENLLFIQGINCNDNQLTSITLNGLTQLSSLDCSNNLIETISLQNLPDLNELKCQNNQIVILDVNELPNLSALNVTNNLLEELYVKNGNINPIFTTIDGNPTLVKICCDTENVEAFTAKKNSLGYVNCVAVDNCTLSNPNPVSLSDIKFYPNPTQNILFLQLPESLVLKNINVYNATGQILNPNYDSITSKLDLSNLSAGLYFIEVETNQGSEVFQIEKIN
uniref:T9SS type A sorting domain-containing protein n=1 Tax=Flavobacterium sp. TaxID=239 RepID=UPI00404A1C3B